MVLSIFTSFSCTSICADQMLTHDLELYFVYYFYEQSLSFRKRFTHNFMYFLCGTMLTFIFSYKSFIWNRNIVCLKFSYPMFTIVRIEVWQKIGKFVYSMFTFVRIKFSQIIWRFVHHFWNMQFYTWTRVQIEFREKI